VAVIITKAYQLSTTHTHIYPTFFTQWSNHQKCTGVKARTPWMV